jgi:hypothetical protein
MRQSQSRRVQDSLTQAVMQGISHIGVVTGHLRSSGEKKELNEQRTQQILSLLESAASSLKSSPGMSAADAIVSDIVHAAHELVRAARPPPRSKHSHAGRRTGGRYDGGAAGSRQRGCGRGVAVAGGAPCCSGQGSLPPRCSRAFYR